MRISLFLLSFSFIFTSLSAQEKEIYSVTNGKIDFTSDAPLELIKASSTELKGLIDVSKATFAFTIHMNTFQGFNSPLQREHFNENYLETKDFPKATFSGKIIDAIDFSQPGTYQLRAKGMLTIHGMEQERIIRSEIVVSENGEISITTAFSVPLDDHGIRIPKIVYQKIAEEIAVLVEAELVKR